MIHEVGSELERYLRSQGCPVHVEDGPEANATSTWGRERIVIEYDDEAADAFTPTPKSQSINPPIVTVRVQACKVTIYAQSTIPGARTYEHRRRASNILDQVLVGLKYVGALRKNACVFGSGHFFVPEDLVGTPLHGGAAYELKFTFERGVSTHTFKGDIQPEAKPGQWAAKSTTKVSAAHGPDDDNNDQTVPATAETACGA